MEKKDKAIKNSEGQKAKNSLAKNKKKFVEPELIKYDDLDEITLFTRTANASGNTFF